jgi:hypothetical protein
MGCSVHRVVVSWEFYLAVLLDCDCYVWGSYLMGIAFVSCHLVGVFIGLI